MEPGTTLYWNKKISQALHSPLPSYETWLGNRFSVQETCNGENIFFKDFIFSL